MEEEILKVHCAALTCFLNCWPSSSVNFQHFSSRALILNLHLRTLPLELGSAEHMPALSLWTHNSSIAQRCHLASATGTIRTAALAKAAFIPAPLAEDVFDLLCCILLLLFLHLYGPEHGTLILCRSISNHSYSVLGWAFWKEYVLPINIMIKL